MGQSGHRVSKPNVDGSTAAELTSEELTEPGHFTVHSTIPLLFFFLLHMTTETTATRRRTRRTRTPARALGQTGGGSNKATQSKHDLTQNTFVQTLQS